MQHHRTLHRAFEARVASAPGAIAVTHKDTSLTYAQLNARANGVAQELRRLGVGRGQLVGLCLERGLDMIVGLLGILKAGGAYVPLDPAYPSERLSLLLKDSAVPVVVTTSAVQVTLPDGATKLSVDRLPSALSDVRDLDEGGDASDLAYVIYTSGSTGVPKGVLVEHGHVLRLFSSTDPWFQFRSSDVWTMFHSFGFDFSVWEIWGALLHGGRLVVVPSATARAPEAFLELLSRERVTMLSQTPSAFQQLSRCEEVSGRALSLALRTIVFGGEALDPQMLRGWVARHGDDSPVLVNMYGITETTVHVTYRRITRSDLDRKGVSPIGIPIPDLTVHLLDAELREVADGQVGEMYVGGAGVARGYLHRPELDAQRFIPDPFRPGARLYRSGDLAVRLPSGELEYRGRGDAQLKIRGYRIEAGEVESALRSWPGVADAAVIARDYGEGDKRLVAYLVPTSGRRGSDRELIENVRTVASRKLPEHMRPSSYQVLDALPLNTNGKVDRAALPAVDAMESAAPAVSARAGSQLEQQVSEIFSRALGVAKLDPHADFFEVGGTSLTAIKILLAVQERLGVALDMSVWSEHATPAGFVRHLERLQTAQPSA